MTELTVRLLHQGIGAEVTGIDLSKPVGETTKDALSKILAEHLALVFPGQSLTPAQ
jgi:alpha-ketoglutarate-dependent taurine dioxygenase